MHKYTQKKCTEHGEETNNAQHKAYTGRRTM